MRRKGWADLYDWRVERASRPPIFRQIYLQIRSAILSGAFPAGTKLPSTRELASRLAVARASVVSAYEQLFVEGYLSGKVGSGTYVSSDLPQAVERVQPKGASRFPAKARQLELRPQVFNEFVESTLQSDERPFNPRAFASRCPHSGDLAKADQPSFALVQLQPHGIHGPVRFHRTADGNL
jgi:GntR family transcriptional regulator/MocR family aminotransferase